jgi:hypothetical protein
MRSRALAATAVALVASVAAVADGKEAIYRIGGVSPVTSHVVNGFSQTATREADGDYRVRVTVPRVPIGAPRAYRYDPAHRPDDAPDAFSMPDGLAERLGGHRFDDGAATEVLRWVERYLVSDDEDFGDQDALSVLVRRRGRCSGIANATVALLRGAGFRARTVSGVLVTDDGPVAHRWLECWFDGRGWVPTDPAFGFWVVTHRHVAFPETVHPMPRIEVEVGVEGTGVEGFPTDRGVPSRPSTGAELVVRWVPSGSPTAPVNAHLIGAGGEVRSGRLDPVGRFGDLLPGSWLLRVESEGTTIHQQLVSLDGAEVVSYVVREDAS